MNPLRLLLFLLFAYGNSMAQTVPACKDTSSSRLLNLENSLAYLQHVSQTKDNGILLSVELYDTTRLPNPYWRGLGALLKLNEAGDVIWRKQFEDMTVSRTSTFFIHRAFELPNGDILCAALQDTTSGDVYRTLLFRLTPQGNVIWQTNLKSTVGMINSPPGSFRFYVESVAEGLNGDLIICGTTNSNFSAGKFETVVLLNSQGQMKWDANYGNHGIDGSYRFGAEGVSAFMKNGNIILVGLTRGSNNPPTAPAITFLTLKYSDGNLISKRFFRPEYPDIITESFKGFSAWRNNFRKLANGHYVFYGQLSSDLVQMTDIIDHVGVVEFDSEFNLVNGYTVSSRIKSYVYNTRIAIDSMGKGLLAVPEFLNYSSNVFFASFYNGQFQSQRKIAYPNISAGRNGFAFLQDRGQGFLQTHYDNARRKPFIEFRTLHDSDASTDCLGIDSLPFKLLPLNIIEDPGYFFLDPNEPNKMITFSVTVSQSDTIDYQHELKCKEESFCDSVKIRADTVICSQNAPAIFTTFRNAECGAITQWGIDKNVIDSTKLVNDTTVLVWFKDINWEGKITAWLPAGACTSEARDSVGIRVIRRQPPVNLGADRLLCEQDIILRAGKAYRSYIWNDGSIDSNLVVNAPGKYWVRVTDSCGNAYSDTVTVTKFSQPVSIGQDRQKCNSDTLQLHATAGFDNYVWGPQYNISSLGNNAVVNPRQDTIYFVRAEKAPGCFAFDTIRVKVFSSPAIDLGNDTSLCINDTLHLDAGAGFSSIAWSNGMTTRQITVTGANTYSVVGTTAEGCKSYDTLKVLNIWNKPTVRLNDDPELCIGSTRLLDPGNFMQYVWHDGSTSSVFIARDTGIYSVTVKDDHNCRGSDTIHISTLLPLPSGFLPADTEICNYGNLLLQPLSQYDSYKWNNGATTANLNINKAGRYWLEVMDANGCYGRDSINVVQKECLKGVYFPNAFTPDGNRRNDTFKPIVGGLLREYKLSVYNRWGQLIFSSTNPEQGWDGTIQGRPQDTNVFVWICKYRLDGEDLKTAKGTVMIVR